LAKPLAETLEDYDFVFSERGEPDVRGFGKINLYYLTAPVS
jgi:hypothetical protein